MLKTVLPQPRELITEEAQRPRARDGEVVIRVQAVTLCGSDARVWTGEKTGGVAWPATTGHEVAGEIAELGAGVDSFHLGQPVSLAPWFTCGRCVPCVRGESNLCDDMQVFGYGISGGLAEYAVIPAAGVRNGQLVPNKGDLPPEIRALAEPLACVYHGHVRSRITEGSSVLIMGGGPIGLLHVKLARMAGAGLIIVSEPSASRRSFAERHGAHLTVNPTTESLPEVVTAATAGTGVDSTIICIGYSDLVPEAINLTRKGGLINLFAGFGGKGHGEIDLNAIHYRQQDIVGNSGALLAEYVHAVELIESGRIDLSEFITHRFGLSQLAEALDMAMSGDAIKVAVIC